MEGLYLYCIREKSEGTPAISTKGIDEKEEVFVIPCWELEAVVSKVSLEEFSSAEIQKRAQEDLKWIKEKAIIHEKVIEEAMRKDEKILSLIPMKFGTIFKEEKTLTETLDKYYEQFKLLLEKLEGKQEWSVKAYLTERKKFEQVIKDKNEAIKQKEKEIADLPEGMAFFMEEELKEIISKESDKELNNMVDTLFKGLKKQTVGSVKNKILEKVLTGRQESMILNAVYLVPEEKIEDFKKAAEALNQQIQANGFCLEYSGPWPPYNFTQIESFPCKRESREDK